MLYTLVFVGVAFMEVMGMIPQEIKSSGITIEGMLSKYFGDEVGFVKKICTRYVIRMPLLQDMHFIYYHIRRTTVMTVLHCFIPLLYCIGLNLSDPSLSVVSP